MNKRFKCEDQEQYIAEAKTIKTTRPSSSDYNLLRVDPFFTHKKIQMKTVGKNDAPCNLILSLSEFNNSGSVRETS